MNHGEEGVVAIAAEGAREEAVEAEEAVAEEVAVDSVAVQMAMMKVEQILT